MTKMTKFRNIIVHDHARIQSEVVVSILRNDVEDLKRFSGEILLYLK